MSPEEIATIIEEAEQALRQKKYESVSEQIEPVLTDLKSDALPKECYASVTLARLARVLRIIGYDYDDTIYPTAENLLDQALRRYPDEIDLLIEHGWLNYDRVRFDKALTTFRKIIDDAKVSPTNDQKIRALEGAAASLRRMRRFIEADEAISEAISLNGGVSTGILVERGWLHFYQDNYDRAFTDFEEVLRRPDVEDIYKRRAMSGQIGVRLVEDVSNSDDNQTRAQELLDKWSAGTPGLSTTDAIEIVYTAATVFSLLNNYRPALFGINLVLRMGGDNNPKHLEFRIETLKWLRRFKEAEQQYLSAQQKFPDNVDLRNEIGHTYYQQKRHMKALECFDFEPLERRFSNDESKQSFIADLKDSEFANEWTSIVLRRMYNFAEAEKRVDDALARLGASANLLGEKAALYFERQEYEKAIKVFDRALKLDEYNEYLHQWRVASFRQLREYDKAKQSLDKALAKLPTASGLWEERAWLHFDQNELNKADECFAESIKLDPYLPRRQFSRVEVLTRLNRYDSALEILLALKARFPKDLEVVEQLGWFYLRRHELEHARNQFEFIKSESPDNVLAKNGMGGYFLECREYKAAEDAFRSAIRRVDYEPQFHTNLAWALVRQVKELSETRQPDCAIREKLLKDAAESCRNALKLDPYNATAFSCLGVIAFKRNYLPDAEGYFRKSLELNPRNDSHIELGALYVQMGRYEEAKKEFLEAINVNRNDARAHIEMANLLLLTEDSQGAIRECRQAVSIDPNNDEAHRALATALMRAGQYEEAEAVLRKAISHIRNSEQWRLHLLLSQILVRRGDDNNKDQDLYNEALKHVNEAKRLNRPAHSDIHFHAGIVDYKLEDYRSAHRDFKACLDANRERFDAERYSNLVKKMIHEQRRVLRVNIWAGYGLALVCFLLLIALATFYYRGTTRTVPESELASSSNDNRQRLTAVQTEKVAAEPTTAPRRKEELIVDKSMLTFMTPLLLGLLVVALLLPNLNKLKLPGGFEAEISELKTKETISTGPKGDIGFGSSLPIISPGPGGRS